MEKKQQTLDGIHAPPGKRNHFEAEFDKFYSIYAFDLSKYHALCKMLFTRDFRALDRYPDINPDKFKNLCKREKNKVKRLCYVLDDDGKRQHLGDEKHIYRVKALKRLREALVPYIDFLTLMTFSQDLSTEIIRDFGDYTYYEERYTTEYFIYGGTKYKGQAFTIKEIELKWVANLDIKTQVKAYISVLRLCKRGKSLEDAISRVKAHEAKGQ